MNTVGAATSSAGVYTYSTFIYIRMLCSILRIMCLCIYIYIYIYIYRGADKFLVRAGGKQATATEGFDFHISYL